MRRFMLAVLAAILLAPATARAGTYDLTIGKAAINVAGKDQTAMTINGAVPGPVLRFKEGEDLVINVTNTLGEDTSIHWHGLILPYQQDGVPGISFPGIKPGKTFTYRFPAQQAGTYWYHSHSGMQEAVGMYGALVIEPKAREPFRYDREHVIVLSDWHPDHSPHKILSNLKMSADYYNYQKRTLSTFVDDAGKMGLGAALADMGMAHGDMAGMDHGKMNHGAATDAPTHTMPDGTAMAGMDHSAHGAMAMGDKPDPFYAPGSGLMPKAAEGGKFLSYADLKAIKPLYPDRPAARVIEVRLTGNMERYVWSINGVKYSDAEPIRLKFGERVRFKFVNETMMTHPMHLHGMWQILDNGSGKYNPAKHTISISPGKTVEADIEADAEGEWAFHCHLMYHMATGMFRKVTVERETAETVR